MRAGVREGQAVTDRADGQAAEDVDEQDQDAGDRIAADELAGTVHGAVEVRFRAHLGAPCAGLVLRDQAGVQIGVDGHLLAGHGIQGESGADFRDTARALGDHHEVDDGENDEHHHADGEVAADHEFAERLDDAAGRLRAAVAVQQHDAGRGDVQRQAQQGGEQQDRRKHAELDGPRHIEHGHHDHDRQRDVEREQHVERDRRQRQHDHRQHREHADGHADARCAAGRASSAWLRWWRSLRLAMA